MTTRREVGPQTERFVRTNRVAARRVAGEMVLVPFGARSPDPEYKAAQLYVLNQTGALIWNLLETPSTVADLARNLTDQYETTDERARADVDAFLRAMQDIGAVERQEVG